MQSSTSIGYNGWTSTSQLFRIWWPTHSRAADASATALRLPRSTPTYLVENCSQRIACIYDLQVESTSDTVKPHGQKTRPSPELFQYIISGFWDLYEDFGCRDLVGQSHDCTMQCRHRTGRQQCRSQQSQGHGRRACPSIQTVPQIHEAQKVFQRSMLDCHWCMVLAFGSFPWLEFC